MTRPESKEQHSQPTHGSTTTTTAFILGIPLGVAVLCLMHFGPLRHTLARRYVSHPVECVEVVMFSMAVAALAAKARRYLGERRACRASILPAWDGKAACVDQAGDLLRRLDLIPKRFRDTWIARRARAVLEFLCSRGSANELDDHLRALADNDSMALEASYSLTRFITWAIPILGFLGTVLGITGAISGVTPEVLEQSLGTVTDGLALAFDTTALALGLTMLTMFLSFIVERGEQSVLEQVDRFADKELAHRFERTGAESGEFVDVARRHTQVLVKAVEQLVERQASLWSEALTKADEHRREAERQHEAQFSAGLQTALDRTLEAHATRLAAVEEQVADRCNKMIDHVKGLATAIHSTGREQEAALSEVCKKLSAHVEASVQLHESGRQLRVLEETLNQNLAAIAETGMFAEAMHSLTAAIHLLTARAAPAGGNLRITNRPGNAA
jgi:biopolymer transport protein ExbB/TolQ